jgi:hypothetical protein
MNTLKVLYLTHCFYMLSGLVFSGQAPRQPAAPFCGTLQQHQNEDTCSYAAAGTGSKFVSSGLGLCGAAPSHTVVSLFKNPCDQLAAV